MIIRAYYTPKRYSNYEGPQFLGFFFFFVGGGGGLWLWILGLKVSGRVF